MMEFPLSPHVKDILCGRGMCKSGRLLCNAPNCRYHPKDSPDPDFGRDIIVKGYIMCPRCKDKTDYSNREWDDKRRQPRIKCKTCHMLLSIKNMTWTQWVVSKHRRNNHQYFHKECWSGMHIDVPDEALFYGCYEEIPIVRLIKWAVRI